MAKITHEDEDITHLIQGIERFTKNTKTVYSNGFLEVVLVFAIVLILVPITSFIFVISMRILRDVQPAPKCSLSLTTRYAQEIQTVSL
jgi:preprotein translocase subunit Sss1